MKKFPIAQFKDFPKELLLLRRLGTPAAVQDLLNTLPFNFEKDKETYRSPALALHAQTAHCMEGALIAAAAFWLHGRMPLLMDLKTIDPDVDHVVTLFKEGNRWGAVSKTNHGVLRYRDPVYRDPREIAMSYFNEYFLDSGVKTMRSFSAPFDLSVRFGGSWLTDPGSLYRLVLALDRSPHTDILGARGARVLRRADPVEIEAGKIVEWKH
jgi:hypothetical protein